MLLAIFRKHDNIKHNMSQNYYIKGKLFMKKKLCLIHTINKFMDIIYNPFAKPFLEENPAADRI